MAIRQRNWTTRSGKEKTAWVLEYFDASRKWRLKTFKTKKEAQDFEATVRTDLKQGRHVADSASVTVEKAGELWIETGKSNELVESSMRQCRQHLELHIKPHLGTAKLTTLTVPAVRAFEEWLRANGRSPALTKKVLSSLGSIIADAMERGLAAHNPVREMRKVRKGRRTKATRVRKKRLKIGVDIPTPVEVRAILRATDPANEDDAKVRLQKLYRRALFGAAAMGGLRASELRGLRWDDLNFAANAVNITQRADKWGNIDVPKSDAGEREVPLPALVIQALKEWRIACPRRDTGKKGADGKPIMELYYVFPNGKGHVESHENIVQREWAPLQIAAGVVTPKFRKRGKNVGEPVMLFDDKGKPVLDAGGNHVQVVAPKYSGLHSLRHFYASWCAARVQDGGLGLPLKTVQERMGHATLAMTADTYGHLFPSTDDAEVLDAGERALMGA